jgi:molybdopterin molybdotransferase
VLVTFELFVRPAVNALLGLPDPLPELRRGVLGAAVRRNPHREEYLRAMTRREVDALIVDPLPGQESHMIARAGRADALIAIEAGEGEVPAGEEIRYISIA